MIVHGQPLKKRERAKSHQKRTQNLLNVATLITLASHLLPTPNYLSAPALYPPSFVYSVNSTTPRPTAPNTPPGTPILDQHLQIYSSRTGLTISQTCIANGVLARRTLTRAG